MVLIITNRKEYFETLIDRRNRELMSVDIKIWPAEIKTAVVERAVSEEPTIVVFDNDLSSSDMAWLFQRFEKRIGQKRESQKNFVMKLGIFQSQYARFDIYTDWVYDEIESIIDLAKYI